MRCLTLSAALAVALSLLLSGHASAQERGQVGGPPTFDFPRGGSVKGTGPTSDVIVIGVGSFFGTRVELVAYDTRPCLATDLDFPTLKFISGGGCYAPPDQGAISFSGVDFTGYSQKKRRVFTTLSGATNQDAARVELVVKRRGHRKIVGALLTKPDAAILMRLGQATPIAVWTAAVRGCARHAIARAFDANGEFLGSTRDPFKALGFNICHPPPPAGEAK